MTNCPLFINAENEVNFHDRKSTSPKYLLPLLLPLLCITTVEIRTSLQESYQFQSHCSISPPPSLVLHFLSPPLSAESRLITSLSLFPTPPAFSHLSPPPPTPPPPPPYCWMLSSPLLPTCLSVRNWSNVLIEAQRRDGNV